MKIINQVNWKNVKMTKKLFIGIFAGIISGLFASGGGMVLVPAFVHLFKLRETEARATSVFAILPMVITSRFILLQC